MVGPGAATADAAARMDARSTRIVMPPTIRRRPAPLSRTNRAPCLHPVRPRPGLRRAARTEARRGATERGERALGWAHEQDAAAVQAPALVLERRGHEL